MSGIGKLKNKRNGNTSEALEKGISDNDGTDNGICSRIWVLLGAIDKEEDIPTPSNFEEWIVLWILDSVEGALEIDYSGKGRC